MFPAAEGPVSNAPNAATAASPPPFAPNPAAAHTPVGIVQREPAAANPLAPAAPLTPATPAQTTMPPTASPSIQTSSTPSKVAEVRQSEVAFSDRSARPPEPTYATAAQVEAREPEMTSVRPRVVVEPPPAQRAADNPASILIHPPVQPSVEAVAPLAPLKPAEVAQGGRIVEEPRLVEFAHAQPRPATFPEPAVPARQPPVSPPVDAAQPEARPVEVRIGRIEVRVNSPAPPTPPVVPPAETLAARSAEAAGFDEYDGIRGYRFPPGW